MANPSYLFFAPTGDAVIDGTTHGFYWGLNADRTVDWSMSDGFAGEFWTNPSSTQIHIQGMLATYSYYANIKFQYVGYYATPTVAAQSGSEINFSLDGSYFFPSTAVWARAFFDPRTGTDYQGEVGDVYLNVRSQANFLSSYEPGSAGWFVSLHEIGHVLGLKHPHDDGGTGRPTLNQLGIQNLDIDWATIMSYSDNFDWNLRAWDPAMPMILDVLALQYVYGKNMTTNAGDTVFTVSMTNAYSTLWDASGNDTVSASSAVIGWTIALPYRQLSQLVDTKSGFAIPTGEVNLSSPHTLFWLAGDMENAVGGSGNDTLYGNDANNGLDGGVGNDFLDGGLGSDALIGGAGTDFAAYNLSQASVRVELASGSASGGYGNDVLSGIEDVGGSAYDDTLFGDDGSNSLYGNDGNDLLAGGGGNDVIFGGAGNDTFDWDLPNRGGNDIFYGGTGDDVFVLDSAFDRVIEYSSEGVDTVWASFNCSLVDSPFLENVRAFGPVGLTLTGNAYDNFFSGTSGDDNIQGGAGNDTIAYTGNRSSYAVTSTATGFAITSVSDGTDTLFNVEFAQFADQAIALVGSVVPANETFTGTGGSETFTGGTGNDTIDGGAGLDTSIYSGVRTGYTTAKTSSGYTVTDNQGTDGTDTLQGVERLKFSDGHIALDMGVAQAGGGAALLIGAVLGHASLTAKKDLIGAVIDLFDQGFTLQQLSGAVMRLDVWGILAGGNSSAQIATYLLTTVNGVAPSDTALGSAVNSLTNDPQGDFLWHLAESSANQIQVDLVGLATTGLEFVG